MWYFTPCAWCTLIVVCLCTDVSWLSTLGQKISSRNMIFECRWKIVRILRVSFSFSYVSGESLIANEIKKCGQNFYSKPREILSSTNVHFRFVTIFKSKPKFRCHGIMLWSIASHTIGLPQRWLWCFLPIHQIYRTMRAKYWNKSITTNALNNVTKDKNQSDTVTHRKYTNEEKTHTKSNE